LTALSGRDLADASWCSKELLCSKKTRVELQKLHSPPSSCGFRRSTELGGVLTRVVVVFSPHVELVVTN
jgi:hypothetical protein